MHAMQMTLPALAIFSAALCSACASNPRDQMVSTFYDISDAKFGLQAIAPPDRVRELAICKAVWFAEKKGVEKISLSNPSYGPAKSSGPTPVTVPDGWSVLNTTAYLNAPSPDGNPMVSIAEKAGPCRQTWDWYR